jgi:hypothetical protein
MRCTTAIVPKPELTIQFFFFGDLTMNNKNAIQILGTGKPIYSAMHIMCWTFVKLRTRRFHIITRITISIIKSPSRTNGKEIIKEKYWFTLIVTHVYP